MVGNRSLCLDNPACREDLINQIRKKTSTTVLISCLVIALGIGGTITTIAYSAYAGRANKVETNLKEARKEQREITGKQNETIGKIKETVVEIKTEQRSIKKTLDKVDAMVEKLIDKQIEDGHKDR